MNNVKKERKTIEWEGLEISSRQLEIPGEHFMQRWAQEGQKWQGPNRSRRNYEEVARTHRRTVQKSLNDLDNHNDAVSHLKPGILECEVKWALGSPKQR